MSIFTRARELYSNLKFVNSDAFKELRTYSQTIFNGSGLLTGGIINSSGEAVSPQVAIRLATWFTCLQVRFEAVGMLPFQIMKETGKTKNLAKDHPAYRLLSCRPNPAMTATQFWKVVQLHRDNYGNAYCPIIRDNRGKIISFEIIPDPAEVHVYAKGFELFYKYNANDISSADMLHFKGFTANGKTGLSLAQTHAETVGRLKAIHKYSNRSVSNDPGMYATTTGGQMSVTQVQAFKDYMKKQMSAYGDLGEFPVMYGGYEIKTMGINPKDALYLEQIQATKEDIYGITKVSPSLAKNYNSGNTYNNGEQQNLDFLIWTLGPMLKDIEEECDYKIFSDKELAAGYSCKFNEKALMRTDAKTQAEWLEKMIGNGLYSINDGLNYLDENPIDGGDDHYIASNNLTPLRLLDEVIMKKSATPAPPPAVRNGNYVNGLPIQGMVEN